MKRILFVDDEPRILQGMERLFRPKRRHWQMAFAEGGHAALKVLAGAEAPFDVIITDMRMPGMNGATLLHSIREKYPSMIRIVLSGHTDPETALEAVPLAHQFLSKPCSPKLLQNVIERACILQTLLQDDALRRLVGEISVLPSLPRTCQELQQAFENPTLSVANLAQLIEQDAAMCAKILQLVNSSFFGMDRKITHVREAIIYLGINPIRYLTLSIALFRSFEPHTPVVPGFSLEGIHARAYRAAAAAKELLATASREQAEDAFAACIFHDIGQLFLARYSPERFVKAWEQARTTGRPLHEIEQETIGVTQADLGAYLLALWGLPWTIVEAVAYHHRAPERTDITFGALHASYLARTLIEWQLDGVSDQDPTLIFNTDYLDTLGVRDRVKRWVALINNEQKRNSQRLLRVY